MTITKEDTLKLIGQLAEASVNSYRATNEQTRMKPKRQYEKELAVARNLAKALGHGVTNKELEKALGM